jgi:hypothetical protein
VSQDTQRFQMLQDISWKIIQLPSSNTSGSSSKAHNCWTLTFSILSTTSWSLLNQVPVCCISIFTWGLPSFFLIIFPLLMLQMQIHSWSVWVPFVRCTQSYQGETLSPDQESQQSCHSSAGNCQGHPGSVGRDCGASCYESWHDCSLGWWSHRKAV